MRYFQIVFPAITINNLVVVSLEKYLSTRTVPRTLSFSTVRAWMLGLVVMLFPVAAVDGIRVDLNETHYTVICRKDADFYPFKIVLILVPVQYVLMGISIIYINICLLKTVWASGRRKIGNGVNNAFKAHLRSKMIKGT